MKVLNKDINKLKIVVAGSGAAGTAIIELLNAYANPEIIAVDSVGIISSSRQDLNNEKLKLLNITNKNNLNGNINDALKNADVFIGVSKPNIINAEIIKSMNKDPIIFAMANPIPEIMPELALQAGAAIVATGRSDFPNQINNALVFPGIFRGALDNNVRKITTEHKLKTAEVIASLVANPTRDKIIPPIDHSNLVSIISKVIV